MTKDSHQGSHESPQYAESTVLSRSDNELPQQSKPLRRSSKSIQNFKKAQRNGLDKTSPGTYQDSEDLLSLANAALHMHQAQVSPNTTPTPKVDGVVPLAATRRQMAEHNTPVSPPAEDGRNYNDVAAITSVLNNGLVIDFGNLNAGINATKSEAAMASAQAQNALTPSAEFQLSTGISFAAEGEKQSSAQEEAAAASPTPEGEAGHESAGDESETEPGAGLAQETDSSAEGVQVIAAREVAEGEAQEVEQKLAQDEAGEEAREEQPEMMVMRMEVNVDAEPEAEEVAEADAEVASIMSVELRSEQEADEVKEEVESMPPLEEAVGLVEAAEAEHILWPEAIELKQEAEEDVLFAEQNEYKQQEEERIMPKLFELPQLTSAQRSANADIKAAIKLIDEGDQLNIHEENGLIIFGKSGSGKSTLANMLAGRELVATKNKFGWKIDVAGSYEGAASASGRASPVGNDVNSSETRIPHKNKVEDPREKSAGTAVFDVPGSFDTKGFSVDAANMYLYKVLLKNTINLKVILTIPQNTIFTDTDKQHRELISLLTHFAKTFPGVEWMKGSIALVVTKVDNDETLTASAFSDMIKDILNKNPLVNEAQEAGSDGALARQILEYIQDSVKVFHKPESAGLMKQEVKLDDFKMDFTTAHHAKSSSLQADAAMPTPPASPASSFLTGVDAMFLGEYKEKAEATLYQLRENIKIINHMILDFFREQLDLSRPDSPDSNVKLMHKTTSFLHKSLLQKGEQNIFYKVYDDFTRELLPESYHKTVHPDEFLYLKEECTRGYFLKLHQISRIKEALNPQKPKADIDKLAEVSKILKSLTVENDHTYPEENPGVVLKLEADEQKDGDKVDARASALPLSEQIGGCLHVLKRLVEFEEFCRKLCGAPPSENPLEQTVSECNAYAQGIFEDAINLLAQAPKKFDGDLRDVREYHYRIEAIKWLKELPHQTPATKAALVNNYYSLGLIDGDDQQAVKWYREAIALNPEMKSAHEKLGEIYFKHAQYCVQEAYRCEKQAFVQMIKSGKPLEPDEGLPMLLIDQQFGAGGSLFGINQNVTPPQPAPDHSKQLGVGIKPAQSNTQKYVQKSLDLYKAALDPLIKAGNLTKIEACFAKIFSYNPYDAETLEKQGDYYAGRHNIYDISRALNAFECAKEQLKDDSAAQERLMQKVAKYYMPVFSSHPIFKDYAGSMIDVSSDSSAAAMSSSQMNVPLSPLRSLDFTKFGMDSSFATPSTRSMDVSPARSSAASPVRPESPELANVDFLVINGAAKFADML